MIKPKFKVGEKVIVLEPKNNNWYSKKRFNWVNSLYNYVGKVMEVSKIDILNSDGVGYRLFGTSFGFNEEWLQSMEIEDILTDEDFEL